MVVDWCICCDDDYVGIVDGLCWFVCEQFFCGQWDFCDLQGVVEVCLYESVDCVCLFCDFDQLGCCVDFVFVVEGDCVCIGVDCFFCDWIWCCCGQGCCYLFFFYGLVMDVGEEFVVCFVYYWV